MKKTIILITNAILFAFLFQSAKAQISFSGPTSVVSGSTVTFTAVGENVDRYMGSISAYPTVSYSSPTTTGLINLTLLETNYFKPSPITASNFKYKLTNSSTGPITATIIFPNNTISYSTYPYARNQSISYTITVNPVPVNPYDNWITWVDYSTKYDDADWSTLIRWDKNKVSTPTVSLEVYQFGLKKATIASNISNDGEETIDWTPFVERGWNSTHTSYSQSFFLDIQIKIISDANPSISYIYPKFSMQTD